MHNEGRKPMVTWERAIAVIIVLAFFVFVQINDQNTQERAAQERRELERQTSTPPPGAVDYRGGNVPEPAPVPEYRPTDEDEDNIGVGIGDPSPKNCDEVTAPIPTPPGDPEGLDRDGDGKACEWK